MGRGMAKNLLDKGHEVVAFDTSAEALKEAVGNGAKEATSPKVLTKIIDLRSLFFTRHGLMDVFKKHRFVSFDP